MSGCFAFVLAFVLSGVGIHKDIAVDTRSVPTFCHLLCGSRDRGLLQNKIIYKLFCPRRCFYGKNQAIKTVSLLNQASTMRSRRSPENNDHCQASCGDNSGFVGLVEDVHVNFKTDEGTANITWSPFKGGRANWTGYMINWNFKGEERTKCMVVCKKKEFFVVKMGKERAILVNVSTYPRGDENQSYLLKEFSSEPDLEVLPAPTSSSKGKKDVRLVVIIIALGVTAGLILLGMGLLALYCKSTREKVHTVSDERPITGPNGTEAAAAAAREESYMVSYYPESVKYTERITSIVNWFRETAGYDVIMDKMASNEMSTIGPMQWAEKQIRKASKVLVFLSPGYVRLCTDCGEELSKERSSDEVRRVWYEMRLLKTVFCNTMSAAKMVCIVMDEAINVHDLPSWAEVRYRWPKDRDEIVKRLDNKTEIAPAKIANRAIIVQKGSFTTRSSAVV